MHTNQLFEQKKLGIMVILERSSKPLCGDWLPADLSLRSGAPTLGDPDKGRESSSKDYVSMKCNGTSSVGP